MRRPDRVRRAVEILTSDALDPIVEMVLLPTGEDCYEAHTHDGSVRFSRYPNGRGWSFSVEKVEGTDPLTNQAVELFPDLDAELEGARPHRSRNSYPFAYDQVAQLFDHAAAPDLCVIHSASHNWEDKGGHRGEHGSLDVVQARAPFVLAGAGFSRRGRVERACALVDIAPTVLGLLGLEPEGGLSRSGRHREDGFLSRQDGEPLLDLMEPPGPSHVVGFLLDGCNSNVLLAVADSGGAPNIAQLMSMGTTFSYGAVACLPTVTLSNHTSILTGCMPGHHGILHNAWFDRATGRQVVTNAPDAWSTSMKWLDPGVETVHSALRRARPGSVSISLNEPCDTGATYSTFEVIRRGESLEPSEDRMSLSTDRFVGKSKDYRWSTVIDNAAVEQFCGIWSGRYRGEIWPVPDFSWVNFTLTDSAFHAEGPYSDIAAAAVHDTDRRIGVLLDAVERRGALDRTAFFVVADHGMEETDPAVVGDWGPHLERAGLRFRDEGYGFIYLED